MAHTFFRTFGLTKPSDADIVDFCDALDLNERTELAGLHALYSEPVLIFLEDFGGNAIAFYANSGLNMISHYPETRAIFEALLGASKTVFLAYKPERFLRPHMRNSLGGRFFVPENFRLDSLVDAALAATHLKVTEAPIVFRKSDIPDLYPYVRTSSSNFDIHQIQNAVMKPVPLALTEKTAFPTVFSSKPAVTPATEPVSNALSANNTNTDGLQSLFVRNPLACARFARAVENSGLPAATTESTNDSVKAASYLANEAADYVLKALLARNPEVGARIARQALRDYSEFNSNSRTTSHLHSLHIPTSSPTTTYIPAPTSTHVPTPTPTGASEPIPVPTSTSTPVYTPTATPTPPPVSAPSTSTPAASTTNVTKTALSAEPHIYMYDPISSKMFRLVSDDGTFPSIGNSSAPASVPDDVTRLPAAESTLRKDTKFDAAHHKPTFPVAEPKQTKDKRVDDYKTESKVVSKHQSSYDFLKRLSTQTSQQFANVGYLLNAINNMKGHSSQSS